MQTDRVLLEASVEYRIKSMTPEERVARVRELREKAPREYLPRYLEMMQQANGSASVIDRTAVHGDAAADDQPVVGELAAQPEPSAGLGSEPQVNGGGHVDQPRRAARAKRSSAGSTPTRLRVGRCARSTTLGGERHTITGEGVDEIWRPLDRAVCVRVLPDVQAHRYLDAYASVAR